MTHLVISKDAFTYLVNQRGEFVHLASDVSAWYDAYYEDVQKAIDQIGCQPYHCLDIGSGLGAVDALMARVYGTHCTLIDSEEGSGLCVKHDVPFCNVEAVEQFMKDNGVPRERWRYCDPTKLHELEHYVYDMVLSFRSWCFHYPPSVYLEYVQTHVCPGARIILDVRKDRRDWREQLARNFHEVYVVDEGPKHERVQYVVRGRAQ